MTRDHGGNVSEVSRIYGVNKEKLIDFSASINPLGYPPGLKEEMIQGFESILHYPDIDSFDFVSALSEYHAMRNENILVGNGSTEFFYLIPQIMKPKKALIVTPAFSEYEKGLSSVGAKVSYFQTLEKNDFALDPYALYNKLQEGFDVLYVCNPANPTGALINNYDLEKIINFSHLYDTTIIIDEAFIDFIEEGSIKKSISLYPGLIVLRSMTKFFGIPGLRLGYIMADQTCLREIKKHQIPWTVNSLAQRIGAKILKNDEYILKTRQYVAAERKALTAELKTIEVLKVFPSSGNFLLIRLEDSLGLNGPQLKDSLIKENILIRDCSTFYGLSDRFFRVAIKKHEENMLLVEILKRTLS